MNAEKRPPQGTPEYEEYIDRVIERSHAKIDNRLNAGLQKGSFDDYSEGVKVLVMKLEGKEYDPVDKEMLEKVEKCKLDLTKEIPDPEPLITLDGIPICTRGNFSVIIGLPGSRKSFLCTGIAGSILNEDGFLGMNCPNGVKKLLWIDTEQAPGHVARIGKRLNRIARLPVDINSKDSIIIMLREFSPSDRRKMVEFAIKYYNPDMVVLDGLSDLITDPNNPEQSTEVISYLMDVTKKLDCHIMTVIHSNIGSEKARGHLGSEALRKCEMAISIVADGDNSLCKFDKTRDVRPNDFNFTIFDGLPTLRQISDKTIDDKYNEVFETMDKIMPDIPETLSYAELYSRLMSFNGIAIATAKRMIGYAIDHNIIAKNTVGRYLREPNN